MNKLQRHCSFSKCTSLQPHRPLTLAHDLQYSECHHLDLTLFRFASIARSHQGPNSELAPPLESIRGELRNFLNVFAARFPFAEPHGIEFPKLPIDPTYYRTPGHDESLEYMLCTIGRNLSSLEDAFRNAAACHASTSIICTLDLFCRHVGRIHDSPHLLSSYLAGKLSAYYVSIPKRVV
jgi:hypothetical protein